MKSNMLRRAIALLLSLMTVVSLMSVSITAQARYADDFDGTYDDLNCAEDDCDCLEPENNRFQIVSPSNNTNQHNTIVFTGTYQEVQNYFNTNGMTDGLPVIPPTKLKAEKFMRYTTYSDNDVVATVNGKDVTAYQVAVNAIMSGSSAEYLPVCIAFVQALGDSAYLDSLKSGELTPMMYVNGPVARQLGIDNGQGMTTEECNIAIARFMELALINLAHVNRTNAFGNIQPLVFSENEQICLNVGWEPHHVEEGYDLNDNVITATSFSMWGNNITPATDLPEEIMKVMAWDITEKNLGGLGSASVEKNANAHRLIFITESVATALATKYKTKEDLENALVENARRPLWMRTYAYYYAHKDELDGKTFAEVYEELKANEKENYKFSAAPAWMSGITYAEIDTVATMTKGNTDIITTGDVSRNKTQVMPGGVAVSKEVSLPSTWDTLMTSMSYQALDTYNLTAVDNTVKLPSADTIPSVLHVTTNRTYRIVASETYVKGQTNIYYDSASSTLYYYADSAQQSVVLDKEQYADFIAFVEALGINSSFTVAKNTNVISAVYVRFSSNASLPDKNITVLTADSFGTVVPTIAANTTSGQNGNVSLDGSVITVSADLTKFSADLGGTIVAGESTNSKFVTVSGTTVTVDPTVESGAVAVIGADNGDGTYRTMTFVNGGDGTYTVTYNTASTLSLTASAYYLKGTFNNWGATDAFVKTDNPDILTLTKEIAAGTYTFKIHDAGTDTWHGNAGSFTDTANRWTMDSSENCTFTATGGSYEFKFEISTKKLSVYYAQTGSVPTPTTKTVYVGVVEHIKDFVPTLHYWNNSTGLTGDATLVATGETQPYAVGSAYWNNTKQNFTVYRAEIPNAANGMKTYNKSANSCWANEEVNIGDGQILLVWEYGTNSDGSKIYHNALATMITEDPDDPDDPSSEEPSSEEPSSEEPSSEEPSSEEPSSVEPQWEAGYYLVGTFDGNNKWTITADSANMKLTQSSTTSGEYTINYTLKENDEFKVVYTDGYEITKWYPSESSSYVVPSTETGEKTIYFRPTGNSAWANTYLYVEPNAVETKIYLINSKSWTTVNAYAWTEGGAEDAKWPGSAMTKTSEKINGYDVYSATYTKAYGSVIFNNGSSQTADLTLKAGQYYDLATNKWYATAADVPEEETPTTKTVYVGVVEHIKDFVPTLHYWNNSTGLAGDAALVATGETQPYALGSAYWNNVAQNFNIYKTEIPVEANGMKTYRKDSNDRWAAEEVSSVDGKIILVFEYSGTYHNFTGSYTPVEDITPSGTYKTVYFLDATSNGYITDDDANMFAYSNAGDKVKMTQSVDTKSGKTLWSAKIDESATSVTFYRASYYYDEDNASTTQWGTWSAGKPTTSIYKATASGTGSWVADSTATMPSGTMDDYWYGIWIDTKGDGNTVDALKWYKNGTQHHLYVPSFVDLTKVNVYSSFDSFTIDGKTYNNGDAVNLTTGSHTVTGVSSTSTTTNLGTLKVYQSENTAAMMMTTKEELFTGLTDNYMDANAWPAGSGLSTTNFNGVYKDAIETKGSYYFYDETGHIVNSDPVLKKIKGRGNSSFEASMRVYGKYAYNFNLDSKVALIDGSTASKKWCLLANNVDHAMMRNTFIYALADDIGIKYAPETRLVDLYDNGNYLGAYVITEKVEYGKNTMMSDMKNLDDGNEDANIEAYDNEDIMDDLEGHLVQAESSVTVNGQKYTYQYTTSDDTTNWPYHQPENFTEYNYLLEFELYNRYKNEASWFVSPRTGQAVVVKYPEFATKDEMEWIISEFEAAESAIYNDDTASIMATVDVDSFAKMYLLQELSINLDACATSYYIHNDLTSGKLVSSPVWDYDWAFGAYAGNTKYIYNGSSVTTSADMSNPEQMFVKNKALKTDADDSTKKANYNFQAKLVHNSYVWERCQYIWTNEFVPALPDYIDNDYIDATSKADDGVTEGKILSQWLPAFKSSVEMNDARWGAITFTGDDWGTKVTSNYNNRSFNFYVDDTSKSGTATKSYANTVYYLNDWLVKRWNYMSSSTGGNLYNASLLDAVKINSVAFTGTQNGSNLTISAQIGATYEGAEVEDSLKFYEVYVNGESVGEYPVTQNASVTLEENKDTEVYIKGIVKNDEGNIETTKDSDPQTFKYSVVVKEYIVENVSFVGEQSDDEATLKVTPSATVTYGGEEVAKSEYQYYIYLNGALAVGPVKGNIEYQTIDLEAGIVNEVYVKVTPVDKPTIEATSITQKFSYGVESEMVEVTFNFKSSSSSRYVPTLTVGDTTAVMVKDSKAIAKNASQTQSYYWYKATVELPKDKATKVTFTNSYSMNASTTLTLSSAKTMYFGVDNLNKGTAVVDLTNEDEYVRNFVKSASHMVYNEVTDNGTATTSISGTIYKMGDADEDNKVSVLDATLIQKSLVNTAQLSKLGAQLADFDLDSKNTVLDATMIQIYLTH